MYCSAIGGLGCFAARTLLPGASLGRFHGKTVSRAEAQRLSLAGASSILSFTTWRGTNAWLYSDVLCPLSKINSSRGAWKAPPPNVEFVCDGQSVSVVVTRPLAPGDELLADYDWSSPTMSPSAVLEEAVPASELVKLSRSV